MPPAADAPTGAGLRAVYSLLAIAMARETTPSRDLLSGAAGPDPDQLRVNGLLEAIRRHRLAVVLEPHLDHWPWSEEKAEAIRALAARQRLAAMAQLRTALEALRALADHDVRALLIKGPALAMQTTANYTDRGGGDVDLFVSPDDLSRALGVLEGLGYGQVGARLPRQPGQRRWRYVCWVHHEQQLRRPPGLIDLHWALSPLRHGLPDFEAAWAQRATLPIDGQTLATLSRGHALAYACVHAQRDQWMDLRALVDIDRLARPFPPEQLRTLQPQRALRLGAAVTMAATGAPHLEGVAGLGRRQRRTLLERAWQAQLDVPHQHGQRPWQPQRAWHHWRQGASLMRHPEDLLRTLAFQLCPPSMFQDSASGADLPLGAACRGRMGRLTGRLGQGLQGGDGRRVDGPR
jgi:hypothetical protein